MEHEKVKRIHAFNTRKSPLSIRIDIPLPPEERERISRMAHALLSVDQFPDAEQLFPLWEAHLSEQLKQNVEDDWIRDPGLIYPKQYDQGIHGALLGARMSYLLSPDDGWGWASSNSYPLDDLSYEELLKLQFDPGNHWLQKMASDLSMFVEKSCGRFHVSTIVTLDGLNFGHQLAGFRIFTDIFDHPDELKALMEHAADLSIQLVSFQRRIAGDKPGESHTYGGLFPGGTVPMSVDTYNMCSPAIYAEFGRPYQQRVIDHFGGGAFHLHGNGRHLLLELARLNGFVYLDIADDGAPVRAFEDRFNIRRKAGDLLIGLSCREDEMLRAIHERSLVPARYSVSCTNRDEAARLLEAFRDYQMKFESG